MRYNNASDVSVKILVFEAKLEETKQQNERLDEAIRTARLVRNACITYWMDNKGIGKYELSAYCAVLGKNYLGLANSILKLDKLLQNERGLRFLDSTTTVQKPNQERKVSHTSKNIKLTVMLSTKRQDISCLKTGKVAPSPRFLPAAGIFKLWGNRDLHFYQLKQIKRVRVVCRVHGYYVQFCIDQERIEKREPTNIAILASVSLTG